MKPLYLDNHVLVLFKPAGIATQPDFTKQAKQFIKEKFNKPGAVFLHPIHRLDKPVSGLVLFARTSKALSRLNESMRKGKIQKTYQAWVEGEVDKEGILQHTLLHGDHIAIVDPSGKEARLSYKRLGMRNGQSKVEIELHTGRYHQIRIQFSHIGHPIVGDVKYGATHQEPEIALTHFRLAFPHPTKEKMIISAL